MNNAISQIKTTLEGTDNRITEAEDMISEVEDRMMEINEAQRKKEKELKEMRTTSETTGTMLNAPTFKLQQFQKKKTKTKGMRKYLKIVENFPKMGKEIAIQVQETQRVPNRINLRRNAPRHILIK